MEKICPLHCFEYYIQSTKILYIQNVTSTRNKFGKVTIIYALFVLNILTMFLITIWMMFMYRILIVHVLIV